MTLIDVNGESRVDAPYLCVQLEILDENESDVEIVELPDLVKTERPFKGYESIVLSVHEHIENQVFVDVMEAVKRAGVQDVQINPCG